jgi:hypothetical protein
MSLLRKCPIGIVIPASTEKDSFCEKAENEKAIKMMNNKRANLSIYQSVFVKKLFDELNVILQSRPEFVA